MHIPVMLQEMLEALHPEDGKTYVDGTFGGGGYTKAILDAANCHVVALDRDPEAIPRAVDFKERFTFIHDSLKNLHTHLKEPIEALVLDLGVSSFQLDNGERGFSFRFEGPLDMRMSCEGLTVKEVINTYSEKKLIEIIEGYGEESRAKTIAKAIVNFRYKAPLKTTKELADLVASVVPKRNAIHPATKTFQAFRIYVNDELQELYTCLQNATYAKRLVIVTFQGLEVRVIKKWYRAQNLFKEGIRLKPSRAEIRKNPRSRSAELRVFHLKNCN